MGDVNIDLSLLPEDVREKLAELELELSEGRRTDETNNFSINIILQKYSRDLFNETTSR